MFIFYKLFLKGEKREERKVLSKKVPQGSREKVSTGVETPV